jgi:hypothetical protein
VRSRLLIILGALCIGLAWCYLSLEQSLPEKKSREEKLFTLNQHDISRVDIQGGALISLIRKGKEWWVAGEVNFPADQPEAANLIRGIVAIPVRGTLSGPKEEFGLDQPGMKVTLYTTKGEHHLSIGSDSPTSSFCYASVQGRSGVFLLPAGTKALFRKSLLNLTDKHLIHVNPWDVSRVRVVKQGSILELTRDGAEGWRLAGDARRKLSEERVNEFFKGICRIQALSFPEDQSVPRVPDVAVELFSTRGVQTLRLWKEGDKAYALSDYQRGKAEISAPLMQGIPSGPDDLLDRSIAAIAESSARKVVFSGEKERVFLMHDGTWYEGKKRMKDGEAFGVFFRTLSSIVYEDEYLMLPRDAGPGLRVRVYSHPSSPPFDITVHSQYYVAAGKRIYRINEGDMMNLKASLHRILGENE